MTLTVRQQVKKFIEINDYKSGLKILAKFRDLHGDANVELIKTAYEMMLYPDFYKSLKKDITAEIQNGVNEMIKYYG